MIDRETTERYQETQEQALKLIDLFKVPRSFCALNSSAHVVLLRLLLLPLLTLLICFCSDPFLTSDKWWSPQNKAALLVIYSTLFSIVSIFFTIFNESIIHGQSEQDITDGVYSKILSVLSFLFASAPNDLLAFTSSILIISFCAPRTFLSTNDWRHMLMYINFYRYLLSFINFKFINGTKAGDCIFDNTEMINNKPMEQFCR
ncbi:hypothetical protein WUBG_03864 [Wuchereria bancrofti]|uniref:Uncharacterized protein n=1 Tax=Wuchereria bancrofti TaxID=6293 RepID=J9ERR9_WUCBA|nr:hypothetical protein WUBG_03864 [Wuchereria bancrofti]